MSGVAYVDSSALLKLVIRERETAALHLATALSIEDPALDIVTYDRRFAEAASASGLRVVQPGT